MTEQVFDLEAFLDEATKAGTSGLYGKFQQAVVTPGFFSFAEGLERADRFVAVENGDVAKAKEKAASMGDKGSAAAFRVTLIKDTSVVDINFKQDEDWNLYFVAKNEKVNGLMQPVFEWGIFADGLRQNVPSAMYDTPIWIHLASKRHPRFNPEDKSTFGYDTVRFKDGEIVYKEDGTVVPRYHDYIEAAFSTKEELVEYCRANGVEVEGGAVATYPVPAGWVLDAADWPECATNIMAELAGGKPVPSLLTDWKDTGVTMADLNAMKASL